MDAPRKKINGREFVFGFLKPSDALKLEPALAVAVGAGLGEFADQAQKDPSKIDDEAKAIIFVRAATAIIQHLPPEDYTTPDGRKMLGLGSIFRIAFSTVTCDGVDVDMDVTFVAVDNKPRHRERYQVLAEALRVNFSDFFSDALRAFAQPQEKAQA